MSAVEGQAPDGSAFFEFTAQSRMSGIDLPDGSRIRKGAPDTVAKYVQISGGTVPPEYQPIVDAIASRGATPLAVAENDTFVGVVKLEDILKPGISERFARLRQMGLRVVMVTGDNPLTAKAIAEEAGVNDYIAQATPEAKLAYIRKEQHGGKLVAMMGDGTNDAPALAQADIGVAMNSGTQAAKEAGNMVNLDSDPTKLIEVVEIGKQLLMTRGALTTFSIANDLAKYFAVVPALFVATLPGLEGARPDGSRECGRASISDSRGSDLQCDHHSALDSRGAQRSEIPSRRRRCTPATELAVLRARRCDRALHRDQIDRPGSRSAAFTGGLNSFQGL